MFFVRELESNYSGIPTGWIEDKSFDEFVEAWNLSIFEEDKFNRTAKVMAEWGNGEGHDFFEIEFGEETETINFDDYYAMVMDELKDFIAPFPSLRAYAEEEYKKNERDYEAGLSQYLLEGDVSDLVEWLEKELPKYAEEEDEE